MRFFSVALSFAFVSNVPFAPQKKHLTCFLDMNRDLQFMVDKRAKNQSCQNRNMAGTKKTSLPVPSRWHTFQDKEQTSSVLNIYPSGTCLDIWPTFSRHMSSEYFFVFPVVHLPVYWSMFVYALFTPVFHPFLWWLPLQLQK